MTVSLSISLVLRDILLSLIEEQELNQGTFVEPDGDVLHGLRDKLRAEKIREIGLSQAQSRNGQPR